MFFKSKKKEEKKELLYRENIRVNCSPASKEDVIREVGQMLVDSGYVDAPYIEGMIEREKIGAAGIKNVKEHFTKQIMCDKTIEVYKELINL